MAKTSKIEVRMSDKEKSLIEKAAKIRGQTLSEFVREQLVMTSRGMVEVKEREMDEDVFVEYEYVRIKELSKDAAS